MSERLPTHLEVGGILRSVEANGDFATIVRRGEPDRGSLLILIESRGRFVTALERVLDFDGGYAWRRTGPAESAGSLEVAEFLAKRTRFDDDLWAIEVDIAQPERFIAETTASA